MNRDWAEKDFYQILGVGKSSTPEEIKRAYRKLARRHHPDANPGNESKAEKFKGISEAYSVLSDAERRREYDEVRRLVESGGYRHFPGGGQGAPFGGQVNLEDLLGGFGDLFGRGRHTAARKGADLAAGLRLTFEESIEGGDQVGWGERSDILFGLWRHRRPLRRPPGGLPGLFRTRHDCPEPGTLFLQPTLPSMPGDRER